MALQIELPAKSHARGTLARNFFAALQGSPGQSLVAEKLRATDERGRGTQLFLPCDATLSQEATTSSGVRPRVLSGVRFDAMSTVTPRQSPEGVCPGRRLY